METKTTPKNLMKHKPWYKNYRSMRNRCSNYKNPKYGALGIKCFLSFEQMGIIWKRDNAHLMKRPSIDRINSDENYTLLNCRFVELSENSKSFLGRSHREETKKLIAINNMLRGCSPETRAKMSSSAIKRNPQTRFPVWKVAKERGANGKFIRKEKP